MNLPRRRRSRPKGRARLTVVKDVQARKDAEEARQWLSQLKTDPANGTTVPIPLAGLRGQPHYAPAPVTAPPRTHQAAYGEWTGTMTVSDTPASAADHMDGRCRRTRSFLDLKVAYLKARGMGYRIDDAEQVLQRGEDLPAGSVIADTHAEAVTHLLGDHGIWAPGGWNHGWAEGLHWYDPDIREPWWDAPATRGTP